MKRLMLLIALTLVGCTPYSYEQASQAPAQDLSREGFVKKITIKDDPLETRAEINTVNGFRSVNSYGAVWNDNFLRAYIDKQTGRTTYQVYDIIYMKDWSNFYQVNYTDSGELKSKDLTRISSDVISCSSIREYGCTLREDVGWSVDSQLLERVAATYTNVADRATWEYKLKAKSGTDENRMFFAAEVAALLEAVDTYKTKHSLQ
jgi:hypothetical protein